MENRFVDIAALICEPARAKILWSLLDGRSYTAMELAFAADISPTSASNHLNKLLQAELLKVDKQGKHRYYSFANACVAYAVEAIAALAGNTSNTGTIDTKPTGIKYCRTCYDHLAGYVGVKLMDAFLQHKFISNNAGKLEVTKQGWKWLVQFDIAKENQNNSRRPFIRECLDWSERRPHLAGTLGALILEKMFERKWVRKVQFSRELLITTLGLQQLHKQMGVIV